MINHLNRKRRVAVVAPTPSHDHDADYAALLAGVRKAFSETVGKPLFQTSAEGLFDLYLARLPSERGVHTCSTCRNFVRTFGGLVTIGTDGVPVPAMWNPLFVPEFYQAAVDAVFAKVRGSRVTGPFKTTDLVWGVPKTGAWTHFAVTPDKSQVYAKRGVLTAGQAAAAGRENFRTVSTALVEFKPAVIDEAIRILKAEAVHRSESFIAPVQWLRDIHSARDAAKGSRAKENVTWNAVATAPEGYCHPRASVTGSLLEDIAAGKSFAEIARAFNAKVAPLAYQRPVAAPSAGNIAAAEKIVAELGIGPSLERRFARLDEIEAFWKPSPSKTGPKGAGVFGHIHAKGSSTPRVDLPAMTMTWEKFARSVLPTADRLEFWTPSRGNYSAMLTAANPDSPPILKWSNPVSVYVYHGGSPASQWRVQHSAWHQVTALAYRPNEWGGKPMPHLGEGVTIILEGCVDTRTGQGNALFPETLRDDLHQIRATIEAYSKRAEIGGLDEASACGFGFGRGKIGIRLRVTSNGLPSVYDIDRWD